MARTRAELVPAGERAAADGNRVRGDWGCSRSRAGKLDAALTRLRQVLAQIEAMGFRHQLPFCLAALAEAALAAGDHQSAHNVAQRARELGAAIGDKQAMVLALLVLGAHARQHGTRTEARSHIRAALTLAETTQIEPLARQCRAALAALSVPARAASRLRGHRVESGPPCLIL